MVAPIELISSSPGTRVSVTSQTNSTPFYGEVFKLPQTQSEFERFGLSSGGSGQVFAHYFGAPQPVVQPMVSPQSSRFGSGNGRPGQVSTQTFGAPQPAGQPTALPQSPFYCFGLNGAPGQVPTQTFGAPQPVLQPIAYPQSPFGIGSSSGTSGQVNMQTFGGPQPGLQPTAYQQSPFGSNVVSSNCTIFGQASSAPLSTKSAFGSRIGESTTPALGMAAISAFGSTITSPFFGGGCCPTFGHNEQGGSCVYPYTLTVDNSDTPSGSAEKLQSISAMKVYSNKSHEELRTEDYQQGNKGRPHAGTRSTNPIASYGSNCQPPLKSLFTPASPENGSTHPEKDHSKLPQAPSNLFSAQPSQSNPFNTSGFQVPLFGKSISIPQHAFHSTGIPSSIPQDESAGFRGCNCKCNQPNAIFSYPAFVTFIHPAAAAVSAQHFGLTIAPYTPLLGTQTSPSVVPFGPFPNHIWFNGPNGAYSTAPASFASPAVGGQCTSFVEHSGPYGSIGPNGAHSTTPTSVSSPTTGFTGGGPSVSSFSFARNIVNLTAPASVASPVIGSVSSPESASLPSTLSNTTAASPLPWMGSSTAIPSCSWFQVPANQTTACGPTLFGNKCSNGPKVTEADKICCVPKGLKNLVEKLGFNPWCQGKDTTNSEGGAEFLPCEEADKDEDIIALAEFAVEQHNALHKDENFEFVNVVGACLEAVGGGRYHIVLDAKAATTVGFVFPKRFYAVVLRKRTERPNHLTVLEKWLPSNRLDITSL